MICPYCIQGFVYKTFGTDEPRYLGHGDFDYPNKVEMKVPCEECGGMGIIHCCEGMRECNE